MKSHLVYAVAAFLTVSAVASVRAQQGYSSQPRAAASNMNAAGTSSQPQGRRSLLGALSSWAPVDRPSSNSSWRTSNWSNSAAPQQSSGFFSRFRMPWSSSQPQRPSPTGTVRVYKGSRPPELQEQTAPQRGPILSFFLGQPDPEPKRIETVNDFLGQERPR